MINTYVHLVATLSSLISRNLVKQYRIAAILKCRIEIHMANKLYANSHLNLVWIWIFAKLDGFQQYSKLI